MKISDVLWEAACNFSERCDTEFTCCVISKSEPRGMYNSRSKARLFYEKYFSPTEDCGFGSLWFLTWTPKKIRFFHLLSAYEMAKSEGL